MKKLLIVLLAGVFCLGGAGVAWATGATDTATHTATITVAEIAVVDVTEPTFTMAIVAPAAGGALPADVTHALSWLQFTSNGTTPAAPPAPAITRRITAAINVLPPVTHQLRLLAGAPTVGAGAADSTGAAGAEIVLGVTAVDIITGILDGQTGTGAAEGSNLTYTVHSLTMPAADTTGTSHTVTFTLTTAS